MQPNLRPGQRIGSYQLQARQATSSMAVVWRALDLQTQATVALKLSPKGNLPCDSERWAKIQHPHVVHVLDSGQYLHCEFIVMPWLQGQPLDRWLESGPTLETRVALFHQVAQGLSAAHAQDVLHGDLKPANIIVDPTDQPCIIDFCVDETSGCATPKYLAPERFDGQGPNPLSDQFSFCYALYEALFDGPPFEQKAHRSTGYIRYPKVDPLQLFLPIARGLSPIPQQRHPDMSALCSALESAKT